MPSRSRSSLCATQRGLARVLVHVQSKRGGKRLGAGAPVGNGNHQKHDKDDINHGGSPSVKISGPQLTRALKAELAVSHMAPISLEYKPLENGESIQRFLEDLITWVLAGKLHHRSASTCRGIVEAWLKVNELKEVERRIGEIEDAYKLLVARHPELRHPPEAVTP